MSVAEFLQKLVSIYSPSGREESVAQFIAEQGRLLGFATAEVDRFHNAILSIGQGPKTILLLGHIDTVSGFLPVKVENGVLHGRGTVDAKGPFASFLFAALAAAPQLKNTRIIVAGASDEEAGGTGARVLVDKLDAPDAVVIGEPSGWEGVTLGYKGILVLEYFQRKTSTHSANDSEQNVIEDGIAFAEKIRKYATEFNTGKTIWQSLQYRFEKFVFDEVQGTEQVKIKVKVRTPLGFDFEAFRSWVAESTEGDESTVSYLTSWGTEEACLASKNSSVVRAFLPAIRAEGGTPKFKVKTGTADMNTFMKAFPTVPIVSYGPGDSTLDHTPVEQIELAELERSTRILTDVLLRLDASWGE